MSTRTLPKPDQAARQRHADIGEAVTLFLIILSLSVVTAMVLGRVALSEHITGADVVLVAVLSTTTPLVAVVAGTRLAWISGRRR